MNDQLVEQLAWALFELEAAELRLDREGPSPPRWRQVTDAGDKVGQLTGAIYAATRRDPELGDHLVARARAVTAALITAARQT